MTSQHRHYAAARASYVGEMANGARDFVRSFQQAPMWAAFALNDTLQRYRGSVLGPFWIVITSAAFTIGIGLVYSEILRVETRLYLPWIGAGVIVWNLISGAILEGSDAFIANGALLRQSATPLPALVWRVVLRNLINFAHTLVVVAGIALYFGYFTKINVPMAVLGLLLTVVNLSWFVLVVAIVSARFRDMQQALSTILQVVFFLSPVIWIPGQVRSARALLEMNPAFHMLEVLRNPMIGLPTEVNSIGVLAVTGVVGWVFAFLVYSAVRRRIVHYL